MRKLECVDRKKFCGELYRLIVESESNSFVTCEGVWSPDNFGNYQ